MEDLGLTMPLQLSSHFKNRPVLVTGHTGFKGAWLSLWLHELGAEVTGFALPPPTKPSLFQLTRLQELIDHRTGDVRDYAALRRTLKETRPDFIFHLAAQSLVRTSCQKPLETLETNIMGTANLLEAAKEIGYPCSIVLVTSDKCYENRETPRGYRETDPMGGNDPYSASKGCAELIAECWRKSFLTRNHKIRLATARAGNVIGGGDWAPDRIVPDCIRALRDAKPILVRNPSAVRPWQHVLDPLNGYLTLAARLAGRSGSSCCSAWNFGPDHLNTKTVREITEAVITAWGSGSWKPLKHDCRATAECTLLSLDCAKARRGLGWRPHWGFERAVRETVEWYKLWNSKKTDIRTVSLGQIAAFSESIHEHK